MVILIRHGIRAEIIKLLQFDFFDFALIFLSMFFSSQKKVLEILLEIAVQELDLDLLVMKILVNHIYFLIAFL